MNREKKLLESTKEGTILLRGESGGEAICAP